MFFKIQKLFFKPFILFFICVYCFSAKPTYASKQQIELPSTYPDIYKDSFGFDSDSNFIMVTRDQIATSPITYRTIGWTIKRDNRPIDETDSIQIKLLSTGKSMIDPENPDYAYHYFQCSKDIIFEKIEQCSKEWLRELYGTGGFVYFDAVMTVAQNEILLGSMDQNGTVYGLVYFTYDGIASARNWADPEALRTHFDKKIYFPENKKMLYGNYEVHYLELSENSGSDTQELPLTYLGLDIPKTEFKEERKTFEPETLSETDLKYVKTKIVYQKYHEDPQTIFTKKHFTADNTQLDFKFLKIYFYYIRKEQVEQKVLHYGLDFLDRNNLHISAEQKGNPKFDVQKGIPTSEQLRIDGTVQPYYFTLTYEKHSGIRLVPVDLTVIYSVLIQTQTGTKIQNVTEKRVCYVPRSYSYYTVSDWKLSYANRIVVNNYSFPEERVELRGFYEPKVLLKQRKQTYLTLPDASVSIYGGMIGEGVSSILNESEIQKAAERACGKIIVSNDTVSIDSNFILEEGPFDEKGKCPQIPVNESLCTVQEEQIPILPSKRNGRYDSFAAVSYRSYENTKEQRFPITPVNEVVIHTPVICIGSTSDEIGFNQQIQPTKFHSFILGRDFRISVSLYGEHLDLPGYGKRDYSHYVKICQVQFPFDVYDGEQFISEHQWINLGLERLNAKTFYLPVGVEEGTYQILFRTLGQNFDDRLDLQKFEADANKSLQNYGATDRITVQVVGRIYGMEITDILDFPRWTNVFYQTDSSIKTGKTYRIGKNNCNGEEIKGISQSDVFPVLSGSHPDNPFAGVVRLGYRIRFRCKTIGNLYGKDDRVVLKASYYYVDEQAKNRQQVDVYSKKDLKKIEQIISLSESQRFFQPVTTRNVSDMERQNNSLQIWEGEYHLSPDIFLVPSGTDIHRYIQEKGGRIRNDDPIFFKNGYLIIQFMIRTVSNGKPHLDYLNTVNAMNGYCNMWKTEGFYYHRIDNHGLSWEFQNGDLFVFNRKYTIYDDYKTVGTH